MHHPLSIAYVDPGVGATFLQLALAGVVGIGALLKLKWQQVKRVFGRGSDEELPQQVPTDEHP